MIVKFSVVFLDFCSGKMRDKILRKIFGARFLIFAAAKCYLSGLVHFRRKSL